MALIDAGIGAGIAAADTVNPADILNNTFGSWGTNLANDINVAAATATPPKTTAKKKSGSSSSSGGSTAKPSQAAINSVADIYRLWMGDSWVSSHSSVVTAAAKNGWTQTMIIKDAIAKGANTPYYQAQVAYIRSVCGPLTTAAVNNILGSGVWMESNFETQIAPQYMTDVLSDPQSLPFVQSWNAYTGGATLGTAEQAKLKEIVQTFGFTTDAQAQWEQWLTTTTSAQTGNYGAEKRAIINQYINSWFDRPATDAELDPNGTLWKDVGGLLGQENTAALQEALRATDEYKITFAPKTADQTEEQYLSWRDSVNSVGNWYFNDTPGVAGMAYNNSFSGYTNEELAQMNKDGWNASSLQQYYSAIEQAAYNKGVYDPIMTEAFGSTFTDDQWFAIANGGEGSGALKAQLVEAQNRVQFREAYREVFGTDPTPADYDKITNEYVSPAELIRDEQAKQSVDAMYDQTNDLLTKVYGNGVTKDELLDMVLKRSGSGELEALINQATKLDQFTWLHKQQYGSDPTPADYAKYAGYTGPAELQWEIVTNEAISENRDVVNQAMQAAGQQPLTDDELKTLYGERKGYGELRAIVTAAKKKASEKESQSDWAMNNAQPAEIGYKAGTSGGFMQSVQPLADITS